MKNIHLKDYLLATLVLRGFEGNVRDLKLM